MLSILIPIYNYNVFPLVEELQKQCISNGIQFEILCQDDASKSIFNIENEKVNSLVYCSFVTLQKNLAHRENRNSLAEKAKYKYLLFIDGDSIVISKNYIKNYLNSLTHFDVIYGGRVHPIKCPSNNQKLRWKYGRFIEDRIATVRKKKPYQSLLFNNTIIKKDWFDRVKFDKSIKKYGHDDTQLSYQLSLLKTNINHIDNPIEHGDIDINSVYIKKTRESIENLIYLYNDHKIDPQFVKLITTYIYLRKMKLDLIISWGYLLFKKTILKNLEGNNPNLIIFNVFRIGYLCSLNKSLH